MIRLVIERRCEICSGTGRVLDLEGIQAVERHELPLDHEHPCPNCQGTGWRVDNSLRISKIITLEDGSVHRA